MAAWQVALLSATSLIAAAFCAWGVFDIVREWRKSGDGGQARHHGAVGIADAVEAR